MNASQCHIGMLSLFPSVNTAQITGSNLIIVTRVMLQIKGIGPMNQRLLR